MPLNTRELFARLIQCEAGGEGDDGMRAVATVVMNRATVTEGEFSRINNGGDVRAVITQPGQFVCMRESVGGRYNPQNVYNMTPTQEHYDIVDWAMAGGRLLGLTILCSFSTPTAAPVLLISLPMWASYITESATTAFTYRPAAMQTPDAFVCASRVRYFPFFILLSLPLTGYIRRYSLWHLAATIS